MTWPTFWPFLTLDCIRNSCNVSILTGKIILSLEKVLTCVIRVQVSEVNNSQHYHIFLVYSLAIRTSVQSKAISFLEWVNVMLKAEHGDAEFTDDDEVHLKCKSKNEWISRSGECTCQCGSARSHHRDDARRRCRPFPFVSVPRILFPQSCIFSRKQSCIFPDPVFQCRGDEHKGLVHLPSVLILSAPHARHLVSYPFLLGRFAHWELLFMSVLGQHVSFCEHFEMGWSVVPDNWSHWILNFPLSEAPSVVAESSACCFLSPSVQHHKYMSLLWSTTNGKPLEIVKQKLLQQSIVLGWKLLR